MTDFEVRVARADEHDVASAVFGEAMMFDATPSELGRQLFEPERALMATDDGQVIGTTRALTRDLSVPGGVVDAAHVTGVGVRATYRRRGVMSALIGRQLREVPEAIAVLWASEPAIYGRFGYGAAAWGTNYEIDLRRVGPTNDRIRPGALGVLTVDEALKELPTVLRRAQEQRPGVSGRSELRWQGHLEDKPDDRNGRTARQILVHRDEAGTITGYALWRGKMNWVPTGPANEVLVEELVAPDPTAYRVLWQHLLTMDLSAKLGYGYAAVDEPLQQLVSTPTALERRVGESLWVRVTDVPRALQQRQYAVPVDVVLDVTDDLIEANTGRFRLTADGSSVTCARTDDPADLSLPIGTLGATYLGGRPLTEFAPTGRVTEHTPGTLTRTTAAFTWPIAPVSLEIF
ncbi:GNAT family N-acetyltransferase [Kribbella speibonae]|uniref:GNAT family N-acetyltransferase n=1 Tax=Kribbella speibonae TaxID=1572660 RepID=A0ABY2ACU9_9ACTN|nr:GNAT family N-acetyltransferase [Kribbella speibonae]TCC27513.1 GNAT family N-acetyltransferase [Kribbella speibonae]